MADFPIIEKLGGREAALNALKRRAGKPGTVDALRMWVSRGSMPGWGITALMEEAAERGVAFGPGDFVISGSEPAKGAA